MAVARYWRLAAFEVDGGADLRLVEIELLQGGVRVDLSASSSCTAQPLSGSLAAINDESTASEVSFSGDDVTRPGFSITWDFGVDTEVDDFRLFLPQNAKEVFFCELQYLGGGGWTLERRWFGRFTNGNPRVQDNSCDDPHYNNVLFKLGNNLSVWRLDASKNKLPVNLYGTPSLGPSNPSIFGLPSLVGATWYYDGSGGVSFQYNDVLDGDFTVEAWVYPFEGYTGPDRQVISFGTTNNSWGLVCYWWAENNWWSSHAPRIFAVRNPAGSKIMTSPAVYYLSWYFVQWVRQNGVMKLFLNGSQVGSVNDSSPVEIQNFVLMNLPGSTTGGIALHGVRVTKGVVRPSTVPTAAPPEPPMPPVAAQRAGSSAFISWYQPPPVTLAQCDVRSRILDMGDWGRYKIVGTVKRKGDPVNVPLRRRVRLYDLTGTYFYKETWSDGATGSFVFDNLAYGRYLVITYDHLNQYRAVAAEDVLSIPM